MLRLTEFDFEDNEPKRAVLVDVPADTAPNEIAGELHTRYRNQLLYLDLILLRLSVWKLWQPKAPDNNISKICARFPNISVKLLVSNDYEHLIVDGFGHNNTQKFQFENDPRSFLSELRAEELKKLVKQSEALYLSDDNFIFQLPSRILSNSFLRVGNIQTSRGALDSLLFWLLPHLEKVDGILIDTWSISSIALNASRFLSFRRSQGKSLIRVEMLDNYLDGRIQNREELEEILRRVSDGFQKPFLILFSAAMTGKSLKYFASTLSTMSCPTKHQKYLVLFRLGDNPLKVNGTIIPELCDFSGEVPANSKQPDQAAKTQIKIDSTTYFPIFAIEEEASLKSEIAAKHKKFFDKYKEQKAIRIHVDSIVGGQKFRHHGIYIDVLEMLKNQHFFTEFQKIIHDLDPPPKMILIPPHNAGRELAKIAARQLAKDIGHPPEIIERLDLVIPADVEAANEMKEIHEKMKRLNECEALLVLDDVMTTGSRFLGYQKNLRILKFRGQIHYRAGVSRTPSLEEQDRIARTLKPNNHGHHHTLDFVEKIILPNWDSKDCPLCTESRLLDELIKEKKVQSNSTLSTRAAQLRNSTHKGLIDDVFLKLPTTQSLQITPNSFFVKEGATQAVVLCSVAAAVQELRTNIDKDNRLDARGFPIRRVFSVADLKTYTDGILQASLLRCVYEEEFQRISFATDKQFVDWALEIFNKKDNDSLSTQLELALAIGFRKIPIEIADSDFEKKVIDLGLSELLPIIESVKS